MNNVKGSNHEIQCTNLGCEIWTDVWIPLKVPKGFLNRPFLCGFCCAAKLNALDITLTEEVQNVKQSYVNIAKNNSVQEPPNKLDLAREIRMEQKAQLAKEKNLVITSDIIDKNTDEKIFVEEIARDLKIELSPEDITCTKVGTEKNRIIVTFTDHTKRKKMLLGSISLKDLAKWSKTYINPDYTKLEQQQQYNLRLELREKRVSQPEKKWKIFKNKVVENATPT